MPDSALGAGAQLLTWVDEILRFPGPSRLTGLIWKTYHCDISFKCGPVRAARGF
jgi:hypothetical protein